MLPTALGELGMLAPGRWGDVRSEIHALTREMFMRADLDRTEECVENELVNSIAPVYDDCAAKGGCVPQWMREQVGYDGPGSGGLAGWLLLGGAAAAGVYFGAPSLAKRALSTAQGAAQKVKAKL